jgi:hypothetical protein
MNSIIKIEINYTKFDEKLDTGVQIYRIDVFNNDYRIL